MFFLSEHIYTMKGEEAMFFIHVVKPGDSLYSISQNYGVSFQRLQEINGVYPGGLVPGQDIVVPSSTYIVQPGDSLYTIAQKAFLSVQTIRAANRLTSDVIYPGMRLYLPSHPKYSTEDLSFIYPGTPTEDEQLIRSFSPISTYFAMFEYHILPGVALSTLNDRYTIQTSRSFRVAPLATITNLTSEGFSSALIRQVLSNPQIRNRVVNEIVTLVTQKNYSGVTIDFERVAETERDLFTGFLRILNQRLKDRGRYYLSVALPAKTDDQIPWLRGYDYGGIGSVVDFTFIMAYDWHTPDSPPGPVAPIQEVRRTIEYAINQMPSNKIILGFPRYGYEWTMSNGSVQSARAVSIDMAIQLASSHQVPIQYSNEYQQPHFTFRDENGRRHIVWYEDARARVAKLLLVPRYRLRGVGAWQLGLHFPQSGFIVSELFDVRKVL